MLPDPAGLTSTPKKPARIIRQENPRESLAGFRRHMASRRGDYARLPADFQATCPTCRQVVDARFRHRNGRVVLDFRCPTCPDRMQVHHDALWTDLASDVPNSPTRTYQDSRIQPILRHLPRTAESLCPQCAAIILARIFVADGAVYMEKTCPEHGYFRDCINSDALLYSKAAWWSFEEHAGQRHPQVTGGENCPSDCGLCNQHLSSPCLAQIDLTNRCNMRCPICFANAGAAGYVAEPDYDQIVRQLETLRDLKPLPCTAIQFTGGEPTLHPDFLRIVSKSRDMGFSHIQIATNGLTLAEGSFAREAREAGLHTIYLQFDGVGEEAYRHTRNFPGIWEKKLACIESCRAAEIKICLVPTVVKGINDRQVGEIFRFACRNPDVISAISYQPVSFTGRISREELASRRYTLGDLAHDIAEASGASALRDMFPLSIVVPLAQILEALTGHTKIRPSCHTDCAFGTYFLIAPDGTPYPFPRVIDVEGMFCDMNRIASELGGKSRVGLLDKMRIVRMFKRHFRAENAPPGLTVKLFIRSLMGLVDKNVGRGEGEKHTYKTLLCAGMHFQDRYNYDVQRVRRCVILYSTPDGIFPFCTYNCGPEYRPIVEADYARSARTGRRTDKGDTR